MSRVEQGVYLEEGNTAVARAEGAQEVGRPGAI